MQPAVLIVSIAAIVCSAVAAPQQHLDDISKIPNGEKHALECLLSSGLKMDALQALHRGDYSVAGDQSKCLVRCFYEKAGFMDAQGTLQEDAITKQLSTFMPKEHVEELVKRCNTQGTDPCDTALRSVECYYENKAGLL
ncbi:general odorant-binding protein 56d-like [Malaya genurostris]|uniref:general odorant-binding protein 56d-like n=1 Tax=Malaya genurostris TaxID=325434 RepID=UPI0026F3ECA1|nr:general odorant-binding protein 56d-like [Malaya genurostris]